MGRKNWVTRGFVPTLSLFLLHYAELSGEIYGISSKALMETDFYRPLQFKAVCYSLTSDDIIV